MRKDYEKLSKRRPSNEVNYRTSVRKHPVQNTDETADRKRAAKESAIEMKFAERPDDTENPREHRPPEERDKERAIKQRILGPRDEQHERISIEKRPVRVNGDGNGNGNSHRMDQQIGAHRQHSANKPTPSQTVNGIGHGDGNENTNEMNRPHENKNVPNNSIRQSNSPPHLQQNNGHGNDTNNLSLPQMHVNGPMGDGHFEQPRNHVDAQRIIADGQQRILPNLNHQMEANRSPVQIASLTQPDKIVYNAIDAKQNISMRNSVETPSKSNLHAIDLQPMPNSMDEKLGSYNNTYQRNVNLGPVKIDENLPAVMNFH